MNSSTNIKTKQITEGQNIMGNQSQISTTYKVDGKIFIVEPRFKESGNETIGTILIRLIKSDSEKL